MSCFRLATRVVNSKVFLRKCSGKEGFSSQVGKRSQSAVGWLPPHHIKDLEQGQTEPPELTGSLWHDVTVWTVVYLPWAFINKVGSGLRNEQSNEVEKYVAIRGDKPQVTSSLMLMGPKLTGWALQQVSTPGTLIHSLIRKREASQWAVFRGLLM